MENTKRTQASTDLRRYLPLKIVTLIWFIALLGTEAYAIAATWSFTVERKTADCACGSPLVMKYASHAAVASRASQRNAAGFDTS